jgi:peptide/nickel transport system substrate-binding protein/oligopeptide transport system substrate-binding protein
LSAEKIIYFLKLIIAVFFFLVSCTSHERIQDYVYYRIKSNPSTLDPAMIVDVMGGVIAAKLFNGLVRLDSELNIVSDIAESWEVSDDGTSYVFHLRHGVHFANTGREVTADDVKYSFMRILDPRGRSPNTWVLDRISGTKDYMAGKTDDVRGIEIVDDYTLKITLERPFSPFLNLLTMTAAYIVPAEEVKKWGADFSTHPVGTGPFMLKEWRHNDRLVLGKNKNYFFESPEVEGMVYRIIPEDLTAVTEFELGNIDVLTIPSYEYSTYKGSKKWKNFISSINGLNTYYLGFNCSRPPFNSVNLRKAISYSIDREKILATFYENRGRLAEGPVPDVIRQWKPPEQLQYNPERAKRIIEEENLTGRKIKFYVTSDREVVDIAEIIQSYVRKTGLQVELKQFEWSAYKYALNSGEPDMFWLSWWADYVDPENFLFPLFHSSNHGASGNRTMYTNKEVDRFIEAGQEEVSTTARNYYYMRAEEMIAEELPFLYFWHKTEFSLRHPHVRNYKMYPVYSMDKGVDISF